MLGMGTWACTKGKDLMESSMFSGEEIQIMSAFLFAKSLVLMKVMFLFT